MYHPIPVDDTHRIGAAGLLFTNASTTAEGPIPAISGMPNLGPAPELSSDFIDQLGPDPPVLSTNNNKVKARPQPHGEKTYFGLSRSCRLLSDLVNTGLGAPPTSYGHGHGHGHGISEKESRWSKVEPFRFSVEFWDIGILIERERTYSTTHFFAGSWFNVYVQTIKKKEKGVQLGVYLHRQSPGEPFPTPSCPRSSSSINGTNTAATGATTIVPGGLGLVGGVPLGRSMTGHVTVGSPRAEGTGAGPDLGLDEEVRRSEAYRDSRPVTRVRDLFPLYPPPPP